MVTDPFAEKFVAALRCLNAALAIDPSSNKTKEQAQVFANVLKSSSELPPKVIETLKAEFKAI